MSTFKSSSKECEDKCILLLHSFKGATQFLLKKTSTTLSRDCLHLGSIVFINSVPF